MRLSLLALFALMGAVLLVRAQFDDDFDPDMMADDDMDEMGDPDMDDDMGDDAGVETMDDEDEDDLADAEPVSIPREERPVYKTPTLTGGYYLLETFETEDALDQNWFRSKAKKDGAEDTIAKYDGVWEVAEPNDTPIQNDYGLVLKSRARHHAVSTKLDKPFKFDGNPLVVQYEVNFQNGQECGGAYIKLLSQDPKLELSKFQDKTGYTIMFGPDKCGNDDKLHFIFRHKSPKTKKLEEKHAKKPSGSISSYFTDKKTHLYTLVVHPNNKYEVFVDQSLVNSGSLLEDMTPPVNPPKEIVDPDDKQPADWDDRERIDDPDSVKPDDWDEDAPEEIEDPDAEKPEGWLDDEPELIPNPEVEKPDDWDEEMDGEFEAPLIDNPKCSSAPGCGEWKKPTIQNPKYKGPWSAPMIDNPGYKGVWEPRKIANPDYFEDNEPYKMTPIGALGLELWSMSDDILFDNFIITDDKSVADSLAAQTWQIKRNQELYSTSSGKSVVDAVLDMTNERPWLWVLIGIVVLLPIILIFNYCCSSGSSAQGADSAQRKKTDAPSPDDPPSARKSGSRGSGATESSGDDDDDDDGEEEDEGEEAEKAGGDKSPRKQTPKKATPKKSSKTNVKGDEEDEAIDADLDDEDANSSSKSSPKRKTRSRKD